MADGESENFNILKDVNVYGDVKLPQSKYENIPFDPYDVSRQSPVFYGWYPRKISEILASDSDHISIASQAQLEWGNDKKETNIDIDTSTTAFDSSVVHPAIFGYILLDKKPVIAENDERCKTIPDPLSCSPREYCEYYIFPILLPAMEEMLTEAKANKVFEKRRTKFNACDYLTNYLYRNNPKFSDRKEIELEDIPFVKKVLAVNPRPPIPLSLLLSDEEAATIIQAHYRGYKVRKDPEVQELREYQKEMRDEECEIHFKIEDFWTKHSMEDD